MTLAALWLAVVFQASAQPTDPFAAARANFLSHQPGMPTIDTVLPVPPAGDPAQAKTKILVEAGQQIQLGCVCALPDDKAVYQGKIQLVGANLGLDAGGLSQALGNYIKDGVPRKRAPGAPPPPVGDQLVEAQVLQQLLSDRHLDPSRRDALGRRAVSLADSLGHATLVDGGPGVTTAGGTTHRTLSADEIRALNALPQAQATILRQLASLPPPPPENNAAQDGVFTNARQGLDAIGEDPNTGTAMRMTAATLVGVLTLFNLENFENAAFNMSSVFSDPASTAADKWRAVGSTAGNGALTVAGLLPVAAWTKLAEVSQVSRLTRLVTGSSRATAVSSEAASLQARLDAGEVLTREEYGRLAELTGGESNVVFHTTDALPEIQQSGRVAATTESFVYGSRRQINSLWRQFLSGVRPKEGLVVFQGQAAELFRAHEVRGMYSAFKRLAGQQITSGAGDIIITKAVFNAETKTLMILEARMAGDFIMPAHGWAEGSLWGRRVFLDGGLTSGTAFIAVPGPGGQTLLQYTLGATGA